MTPNPLLICFTVLGILSFFFSKQILSQLKPHLLLCCINLPQKDKCLSPKLPQKNLSILPRKCLFERKQVKFKTSIVNDSLHLFAMKTSSK